MGPGDAKREALLGFKNRLRVQDVLARLPAQLRAPGLTLLSSPVSPPALAGINLRKSSQRHSGEGVAAGAVGSGWQRSPLHACSWAAPSTWHTFPLPTSLLLGAGSGATSPETPRHQAQLQPQLCPLGHSPLRLLSRHPPLAPDTPGWSSLSSRS